MAIKEVVEGAKKTADLSKKWERAERKVKEDAKELHTRIQQGKAIGVEHIKLKQSAEHLQKIEKELQLQKKKINR